MTSNEFYLGFTGSTGQLTQSTNIYSWNVQTIKPAALKSKAGLIIPEGDYKTSLQAGDQFSVFIELRDACDSIFIAGESDYKRISFDFGKPVNSYENCKVTKSLRVNP